MSVVINMNALTAQLQRDAKDCYAALSTKVRWFADIQYAANSWKKRKRRIIAKIEHTGKDSNARSFVTNLKDNGKALNDKSIE